MLKSWRYFERMRPETEPDGFGEGSDPVGSADQLESAEQVEGMEKAE